MQTATLDPKFPVFAQRFAQEVRLFSVSPIYREKEMPCGEGGFYKFTLAAQPRDSYQIVVIADSFQMIPDYGGIEVNGGQFTMKPAPKPAWAIAASLAREWNSSTASAGGMGVRVMPQDMVEGTPEFDRFKAETTADVMACATWAVRDASDKHTNGESKVISAWHRAMAQWLYGEQASGLPWFNMQTVAEIKKCAACATTIEYAAKVCKSCGTDLVKFFKEYELSKEDDPYIWAWLQGRAKVQPATKGETVQMGSAKITVKIQDEMLPGEVRAEVVKFLSAENKAKMNQLAGQSKRDAFMLALIPDLANENPSLQKFLADRNYIAVEG